MPEEYKCKKCGVEFIRAQVCPECAEKLLENIMPKKRDLKSAIIAGIKVLLEELVNSEECESLNDSNCECRSCRLCEAIDALEE